MVGSMVMFPPDVFGPSLDRRADPAVDQPDGIGGLDVDVAAIRLARFRGDGGILAHHELRTSVDRDVAGVRRPGAAGGNGAVVFSVVD